jgi:hypothetical protein
MKDKHLGMRVAQERYDDWEAYVEDHPTYDSVSQLVRSAVTEEVEGRVDRGDDAAPMPSNLEGRMDELTETMSQVAKAVEGIDARLSTVEERIEEQSRGMSRLREEIYSVSKGQSKGETTSIVDTLPRGEPQSEAWHEAQEQVPDGVETPIVWSGRVEDIAEEAGVEPYKVEMSLDDPENMAEYETSRVDGETRYWVDEDMSDWVARQEGERT